MDNLTSTALGAIPASDVASVAQLNGVAAAAGGLTLNDTKLTFTIPSQSSGGGFGGGGGGGPGRQFGSGHLPTPISVNGVELSGNAAALGPLSVGQAGIGPHPGSLRCQLGRGARELRLRHRPASSRRGRR